MVDFGGWKNPSAASADAPDAGEAAGGPRGRGERRTARLAFDDVVGQAALKEALLAVAVADGLDGLLIRGEKGTAKSTTVRALADLLPRQRAVANCPYGCPPDAPAAQCPDCRDRDDPVVERRPVPLVTLPLGATRERVVGSLSVADALDGERRFEPGLLARANRGILYVDEVNLLDDHLVDVVLDAAASDVNRVERDGVTVRHPADFTLIGTMNPEEGSLRPQLRDRFGLQVAVSACEDLDDRVRVVERALDREPGSDDAESSDGEARSRLERGAELLPDVRVDDERLTGIAALCREAGVEGHRGDIATARAARALAALDGRTAVTEDDVERAARFALPHRLAARPFDDAPETDDVIDEHFDDGDGDERDGEPDDTGASEDDENTRAGRESDSSDDETESGSTPEPMPEGTSENCDRPERPEDAPGNGELDGTGEAGSDDSSNDRPGPDDGQTDDSDRPARAGRADEDGDVDGGGKTAKDAEEDEERVTPRVPGEPATPDVGDGAAPSMDRELPGADAAAGETAGRAETAAGPDAVGPKVRSEQAGNGGTIDAAATARAAARRGADSVGRRDLRRSVRAGSAKALVVFVVDASASMRPAMRAAKGTVMELLRDAYEERDAVAVVAAAGDDADVLLPPTDSVERAARHLKELPVGDRTPLPDGLATAGEVIDRAEPAASVVVVVTDGRANVAEGSPVEATRRAAAGLAERDAATLVVDAGDDGAGVVSTLLRATDGERIPLAALSADRVDGAAGTARSNEF